MNTVWKRGTMLVLLSVATMSGGCSTITGMLGRNEVSLSHTNSSYEDAYGAYGNGYASSASYLGDSGSC